MSDLAWAGLALAVVGAVAAAPGLLLVGLLVFLAEVARSVWRRFGLQGVEYERRLERDRAICGDVIPLDVTVRNRKLLPLSWLRAVDLASDGVVVQERALVAAEPMGSLALANSWTLGSFERVVRHYHIRAERRGTYALGPVRLSVGDVFARVAATDERDDRDVYLVRPRMLAVRANDPVRAWLGPQPSRRGLLEQSQLFAGTRPYQPGDPIRNVHWKATARTGQAQVKRYDPALQREVLLALDIATPKSDIAVWDYDDELVEGLCVAVASLARELLDQGVATGLAVAAFVGAPRRFAFLAPGTSAKQLGRLGDILARASSVPSAPFGELLSALPTVIHPGTTVLVVSSRDPLARVRPERRLESSGFPVLHVAFGPQAADDAALARRAGVHAVSASLQPDWQTSDALDLVG